MFNSTYKDYQQKNVAWETLIIQIILLFLQDLEGGPPPVHHYKIKAQ